MDLPNTLLTLARDPTMVAWRMRGMIIRVTPMMVIERTCINKPYPWRPLFSDIVAGDWQFGTLEQMAHSFLGDQPAEAPE